MSPRRLVVLRSWLSLSLSLCLYLFLGRFSSKCVVFVCGMGRQIPPAVERRAASLVEDRLVYDSLEPEGAAASVDKTASLFQKQVAFSRWLPLLWTGFGTPVS